ncbi:RNA polymerase II degradation factor 1-like isoform X3 [Juglans microcarpa x Juglans regia]|uniref:RNA polymerase II degradation factor 1-like isoform X3 n=1 Tax=Juglans microcarpa x Juglans regia TaxID=2249226 RepID=UPI001B7EF51C|nr:RNA polymerase II degradation factor 1-like isoform X3 [Juglans microcarpa x Juglans regia]
MSLYMFVYGCVHAFRTWVLGPGVYYLLCTLLARASASEQRARRFDGLRSSTDYFSIPKIADAQPQVQTTPSQTPSHSAVQQGHAMQHPQATMSQQQEGPFAPKLPFQLDDQAQHQHQQQAHYLQQQQLIQGQMGVRPGGTSSMYQAMQSRFGNNLFGMQGSKQDSSEASAGDFLGRLASKPNGSTE